MAGFRVRQAAENDLVEIGLESYANWGAVQMREYVALLDKAFATLAAMPHLGPACDDVRPGLRRHVVGTHVVFYRLAEDGCVEIVRILHARMDVVDHLPGDDDGP